MAQELTVVLFPDQRLGIVTGTMPGGIITTDIGAVQSQDIVSFRYKVAKATRKNIEQHRHDNPETYGRSRAGSRTDATQPGPMQLYQMGIISLGTCQQLMGITVTDADTSTNDLSLEQQLRAAGVDPADIANLLRPAPHVPSRHNPYLVELQRVVDQDPLSRTMTPLQRPRRKIDKLKG